MKKLIVILAVLIITAVSVYGEPYDDAKPVIKEMVASLETFIGGLEKAETAPEVAAAIKVYTKSMTGYAPKFAEIIKKYPELSDEATHPESLKPLIGKMEGMSKKLITLFSKISSHMNDPEVKAAFEELNKASAKMEPEKEKEGEKK